MSLLSKKFILAYKFDWILAILIFILSAVSLAAIYSVNLSRGEDLNLFYTQCLALAIGITILFISAFMHCSIYQLSAKWSYLLSLILLFLVLILGTTIKGTTGWFRVGGFSFQPAEFAKVALILFLADWIYRYNRRFDTWQFVVSSGLAMTFFTCLILLQPDFGSALIIAAIWFGMLIIAGTNKKYILGIILIASALFAFSWLVIFAPYQKERITTFLNPEKDPLNSGYNVQQSIIAIGSGKILGRGLGFGSQSQLHFLPEAHTDFIFAVIGEELGLIGAGLVLIVYILILLRLAWQASKCSEDFSTYTIIGIIVLFFTQIIINIGATIGLLPVTGLTLPFISYGGSSLIMNFLLIGIAESIILSRTQTST
jgi:rod shape determining protein RodA